MTTPPNLYIKTSTNTVIAVFIVFFLLSPHIIHSCPLKSTEVNAESKGHLKCCIHTHEQWVRKRTSVKPSEPAIRMELVLIGKMLQENNSPSEVKYGLTVTNYVN